MLNQMVIVGTRGKDSSGLEAHGPFGYGTAVAFGEAVTAAFNAHAAKYPGVAFPYGEPYVEVVRIAGETGSPADAIKNWVLDPELADERGCTFPGCTGVWFARLAGNDGNTGWVFDADEGDVAVHDHVLDL